MVLTTPTTRLVIVAVWAGLCGLGCHPIKTKLQTTDTSLRELRHTPLDRATVVYRYANLASFDLATAQQSLRALIAKANSENPHLLTPPAGANVGYGVYAGPDPLSLHGLGSVLIEIPLVPNTGVLKMAGEGDGTAQEFDMADVRSPSKVLQYYYYRSLLPSSADPTQPFQDSVAIRSEDAIDWANMKIHDTSSALYGGKANGPLQVLAPAASPELAVSVALGPNANKDVMWSFAGSIGRSKTVWAATGGDSNRMMFGALSGPALTSIQELIPALGASPGVVTDDALKSLVNGIVYKTSTTVSTEALATARALGVNVSDGASIDELLRAVFAQVRVHKPELMAGVESHYRAFNDMMQAASDRSIVTIASGPEIVGAAATAARKARSNDSMPDADRDSRDAASPATTSDPGSRSPAGADRVDSAPKR